MIFEVILDVDPIMNKLIIISLCNIKADNTCLGLYKESTVIIEDYFKERLLYF